MIAGLDGLRFQHWQAELRPDGVLVLSLDRADASVNALSQEVLFELGVNFFDESETNLRQQAAGDTGSLTGAAALRSESGPASDPLFWLLLAVAGVAILANWFVLSPRRSVA
jgi:hypothetical protein